jgi:hypothetical protein
MKNLKKTSVLTVIMAIVFSFAACKKDKNDGPGSGSSSYKFADTNYTITDANEKHIEGDIFLEFTSSSPGNGLQISFANVDAIPEGTLTYNPDRNVNYNPQTNFWATSIILAGANINISGGSIKVTKSGTNTKIELNLETANGPITGEYNGTTRVTN